MARLFGTDGIRGIANTEINCELAMNVARAAATVVADEINGCPTVLIGSDTRISSDMLSSAICAGLSSVGANAVHIGVVPTPAIAYLVTREKADMGIMISASHNPYDFNGIKIFGAQGYKLTDEQEFEIEEIILDHIKPYPVAWGDNLGSISQQPELVEHYIQHLAETVKDTDLSGFHIALDCSNGSASFTAEKLFQSLGVTTTILSHEPDGVNINENCGSTHMKQLTEFVKQGDFDAGFAYDGDADRCIMVDEKGNIVDGDVMMAILALDLKQQNKLIDNTLVATVMSNMGLFRFGKENDIMIRKTKVGDRYVLEKMLKGGYVLGGEQSGHVIMTDHMSTGDGELTSLQVLAALKRSGKKASELAECMQVYPQVMQNIYADAAMKAALAVDAGAEKIIHKAEKILGDDGRILVRPSGTEPVIRVMIEGQNQEEIQLLVEQVSEDLKERLEFIINQ